MLWGLVRESFRTFVFLVSLFAVSGVAHAQEACPARQSEPLVPKDPAMCALLHDVVREPGGYLWSLQGLVEWVEVGEVGGGVVLHGYEVPELNVDLTEVEVNNLHGSNYPRKGLFHLFFAE